MSSHFRFAPSPTGRLHIGNIRTAVLNWLAARKSAGTFLLRLDDTDKERSTEEFADGIKRDLAWLGLGWDRLERQSGRLGRYGEVAGRLKESGRLYPCFETADELDRRRKRQQARGLPPAYDRAAMKLSATEAAKLTAEGRRPHWRFRLANSGDDVFTLRPTEITWQDGVRGEQTIDIGSLSDPVLIKEDGSVLYTLASVVDDIDFGVTDIIRGEDHVTNTGVQIDIFRALGAAPPRFAHHSLLIGADGQGLSKRLGALSVASFRDDGLEPEAVTSHAATLGTSDPVAVHAGLDTLIAQFDLGKLSRSPGRFDIEELAALNARLLHAMPYEVAAPRLTARGIAADAALWAVARGNLSKMQEVAGWREVAEGNIVPLIEDAEFCAAAAALLPSEPWSEATWGDWTGAVKAATGRKGRELFHPLRLALTGRENGPELKLLLPLIGRRRALARLEGCAP